MINLERRNMQPELMDDPSMSRDNLREALAGLRKINKVSRVAPILWNTIRDWLNEHGRRSFSLLDVACGDGEVLRDIARKAHRAGYVVSTCGIDINPHAVALAKERQKESGIKGEYLCQSALEPLPGGYDVVISTLFLHHLKDSEIPTFLQSLSQAATGLVMVHDIERSYLGYTLALVGPKIFSSSQVTRLDAIHSIRGALSKNEVLAYCRGAKIYAATLKSTWPCRWLLFWKPNLSTR